MQAEEVPPGVQAVLSRRPHGTRLYGPSHRQTVHRGFALLQDRADFRRTLHRMRYLRQEVPFRGRTNHQFTLEFEQRNYSPILSKFLQVTQATHAEAWGSSR